MNNDLISRSALLERFGKVAMPDDLYSLGIRRGVEHAKEVIAEAPAVDAVSREVVAQIMWERDTAMEQLKEHGIPFGGVAPDVVEVVRCKDCKHRYEMPGGWSLCNRKMAGVIRDSDFCSKGKRRTDE